MLDQLNATDFEPLVGAPFAVTTPQEVVALDLLTVTPLRERPTRPDRPVRRRPFSLIFRARTPNYFPQGTFALSNDRLGRLDVFMVPVGRDSDGLILEALFN